MCRCCEIIDFWKSQLKKNDKMFSKIAIYGWQEGQKRIKGNESFNYTTKAYDLNYCPQCGRKL